MLESIHFVAYIWDINLKLMNSRTMFQKRILLCLGLSLWFLSSIGQSPTARIVVLRSSDDFMGDKPVWIYADGKKICSVTAGQHIQLMQPLGEHAFYVSYSGKNKLKAKQMAEAVSVACSAEKTTYLLIVSNPANKKSVSCAAIVEDSAEKLLLNSRKQDCIIKD